MNIVRLERLRFTVLCAKIVDRLAEEILEALAGVVPLHLHEQQSAANLRCVMATNEHCCGLGLSSPRYLVRV